MTERTRRGFLRAASAGAASLGVVGTASARMTDCGTWTSVRSPTDRTLHDVVRVDGLPLAVGGGGRVLRRDDGTWRTVTQNGVAGNGRNIRAAATTADGQRAWFAGASGALATYGPTADVDADVGPAGVTHNFAAVAAHGPAGSERVLVGDDSGHVHHRSADGAWSTVTPGDGTAITGVAVGEAGAVAVDASGSAFATVGDGWRRAGVPGASTLRDVHGTDPRSVVTVGDAVYGVSNDGWQTADPAPAALNGVTVGDCGCVHVVGGEGVVLHRMHGSDRWRTQPTETTATLHGVALGNPHVAVGANGVVLEK